MPAQPVPDRQPQQAQEQPPLPSVCAGFQQPFGQHHRQSRPKQPARRHPVQQQQIAVIEIDLPQGDEPAALSMGAKGGTVMFEPHRRFEPDPPARLAQTQRIQPVIAIQEQPAIRVSDPLNACAADEKPHKGCHVNRLRRPLIGRRIQMKP